MMHRIVVDEKKWIDEPRFLHALNFCMLLPGRRRRSSRPISAGCCMACAAGSSSGILFVLPGAFVMLGLSLLYALGRGVAAIDGALFGIKAAVLVIVIEALLRIGKRALKTALLSRCRAGVRRHLLSGAAVSADRRRRGADRISGRANAPARLGLPTGRDRRRPPAATAGGSSLSPRRRSDPWWAPVALAACARPDHVLVSIGTFFSKLAVVSFGGAYAVLAYMAQQAVETHHWMTAPEMVDGLGLAETTPGPLILVTQFVGFLAGFRDAAPFSPVVTGVIAAAMTTWVTSCRRCCGSSPARRSSSRSAPTGGCPARLPPSPPRWSE
jgi:chromate transporter